jgi:two-component sensor histidine kinase
MVGYKMHFDDIESRRNDEPELSHVSRTAMNQVTILSSLLRIQKKAMHSRNVSVWQF